MQQPHPLVFMARRQPARISKEISPIRREFYAPLGINAPALYRGARRSRLPGYLMFGASCGVIIGVMLFGSMVR